MKETWKIGMNDTPQKETTGSDTVERLVMKHCPFRMVSKEIGHKPYTMEIEGLWHIQCTCGARGPISPTEDWAIKSLARSASRRANAPPQHEHLKKDTPLAVEIKRLVMCAVN